MDVREREYKRERRKALDYGKSIEHQDPKTSSVDVVHSDGQEVLSATTAIQAESIPASQSHPALDSVPPSSASITTADGRVLKRRVIPAKGTVDKYGRRSALDFGRGPDAPEAVPYRPVAPSPAPEAPPVALPTSDNASAPGIEGMVSPLDISGEGGHVLSLQEEANSKEPPELPKRKVVPARGGVDKHGRRQALDLGLPPELAQEGDYLKNAKSAGKSPGGLSIASLWREIICAMHTARVVQSWVVLPVRAHVFIYVCVRERQSSREMRRKKGAVNSRQEVCWFNYLRVTRIMYCSSFCISGIPCRTFSRRGPKDATSRRADRRKRKHGEGPRIRSR